MSSAVRLPFHATREEVHARAGWRVSRIVDVYDQLPVGRRYDIKSVSDAGIVAVIDQSLRGIIGYHDDEPGVSASLTNPVVTFANHTCAMRVMRSPFSVIQNVFPLVGRPGICDTLYLYYATNGRQQTEEYKGHHPAWRNSYIALPDVPAQKKIVRILGSIDDLIENNRRRILMSEEIARSIYREWFIHFRFPRYEIATFVDSPVGVIPDGWTARTVDDIVEVVNERVDPTEVDPECPAVGLEHIPRHQLTLDQWGMAGGVGSTKAAFSKGDVLFGKIRAYFHKVSVAPLDGICSTDALVIRPRPETWGQAVETIFSDEFVSNATQTSNGTKMPRADWKVIRKFPIAVPPMGLSMAFTAILRDSLRLAETLMFENRGLAQMRDLLLPRLVTGQIDVSTLDIGALVEDLGA